MAPRRPRNCKPGGEAGFHLLQLVNQVSHILVYRPKWRSRGACRGLMTQLTNRPRGIYKGNDPALPDSSRTLTLLSSTRIHDG
jgi:hypothetical protein